MKHLRRIFNLLNDASSSVGTTSYARLVEDAAVVAPTFTHRFLFSIACVVFMVSLAIHLPFAMFDAFGEQDAARIAIAARHGQLSGKLSLTNQWSFSTPLYIHGLYLALKAGILLGNEVISVMTAASVLFSATFSALFFLFMSNATRSVFAAAAMTLLVQVCPVFWMSSLYGFPTMVALGFFMGAALMVQMSISWGTRARIIGMSGATLLFFVSVLCKVDMVMAAALFCMPVWQSQEDRHAKIGWTLGFLLMSMAAFLLLNRYGVMLSNYQDATSNWRDWGGRFYKGLFALFKTKNAEIVARASGITSIPVAIVGAAWAFYKKSCRCMVVSTLFTMTPIALFWSMISGNSARHNLIPAVFAVVLMAVPLVFLKKRSFQGWCLCLVAACVTNYLWWPPTASTIKPSGRLIENARLLETRFGKHSANAREITHLPYDKILVDVPVHLQPIYYFEPIVAPHLQLIEKGGGKIFMKEKGTGNIKTFLFPSSTQKNTGLGIFSKKGYHIFKIR